MGRHVQCTLGCDNSCYSGDSVLGQVENGDTDIFRARLREERHRLDARQSDFAQKIKVKQSTLSEWETRSVSMKFDHFALLANAGIDVSYVLTGLRAGKLLNSDESHILDSYRRLDAGAQAALTVILDRLQGGRLPNARPPEQPRRPDDTKVYAENRVGLTGDFTDEPQAPSTSSTVHSPKGKFRHS